VNNPSHRDTVRRFCYENRFYKPQNRKLCAKTRIKVRTNEMDDYPQNINARNVENKTFNTLKIHFILLNRSEVDKKVQRLVVMIVYTFYTLVEKYFNFLFKSAKNKILKNYNFIARRCKL